MCLCGYSWVGLCGWVHTQFSRISRSPHSHTCLTSALPFAMIVKNTVSLSLPPFDNKTILRSQLVRDHLMAEETVVSPSSLLLGVQSAPPPIPFRVLYVTEEMVVVEKPPGVAMDGRHHDRTVEGWVQSQMDDDRSCRGDGAAAAAITGTSSAADVEGAISPPTAATTTPLIAEVGMTKWDRTNVMFGSGRLPSGYFADPLPHGNRHAASSGNAGPSVKQLKFVHQLDAPTSGLLCLAFGRDVAARLGHCFQLRKTVKVYSAVLHGWVGMEGDGDDKKNATTEETPSSEQTASTPNRVEFSMMPSDAVFAGIPAPLLAFFSDSATSATMPGVQILSPFAALFRESAIDGAEVPPPSSVFGAAGSSPEERPDTATMVTSVRIDAAIGNDPAEGSTLMTIGGVNPREASTLLQVVKRGYVQCGSVAGQQRWVKATHVLLRLYTGRRHQLRLHCRYIGHPIVGDLSYAKHAVKEEDAVPILTVHEGRSNSPVDGGVDNVDGRHLTYCGGGGGEGGRRMYLHAWRIVLFDDFEVGTHGKRDRVEARKKRRRESLGIGTFEEVEAAVATGISTGSDPFERVVVSSIPGE